MNMAMLAAAGFGSLGLFGSTLPTPLVVLGVFVGIILFLAFCVRTATGAVYIPNDKVGMVEKWWSRRGSVPEGRIIALGGEAGYQADLLRGGLHFGYWR